MLETQASMARQQNDSVSSSTPGGFLSRAMRTLRGTPEPSSYLLVNALFLRALGLVYFIAFGSLAVQMQGLYGSQGILPIYDLMQQQSSGVLQVWFTPTIFWLNTTDTFIQLVPLAGALLALLLVLGVRYRIILILLFALYLSLVTVGQDFLSFQWDYLLLEVGFIAIFLGDSILVLWLYRWLLFRLMFVSGAVKLLSGDPTWRNLTALDYHFETQPLPNIVGFYFHHLPGFIHQFMVAATFLIELVVPFFIFAPRRLRFVAALLMVLLHLQIFLTGNYNFFNLLTMALCILPLDDAALRTASRALPRLPGLRSASAILQPIPIRVKQIRDRIPFTRRQVPGTGGSTPRIMHWVATAVALFLFVLSGFQFLRIFGIPAPDIVAEAAGWIAPLGIVNQYGPFAVMTTARPEIVVEGSNDGEVWSAYEFKYKPGDVRRAPPWVEPHQPRLDWQMWFAALGAHTGNPNSLLPGLRSNSAMMFHLYESGADAWFVNFAVRLLQGSPPVLALLDKNPFPDAPPRYIRARLFDYRFSAVDAPTTTGVWWTRRETGIYFSPLSLGE